MTRLCSKIRCFKEAKTYVVELNGNNYMLNLCEEHYKEIIDAK